MKSRVLIGRPLSDSVGRRRGGLVGLLDRRCHRLGGRRTLRIGDGDHRGTQHPVSAAVTLPQHRGRRRHAHLGRRVVDDGLVQSGVERVARLPERRHPEAVEQPQDAVGDHLEGAVQVTVVTRPLDVVDDGEQLRGEALRRLIDDEGPVTVHPPPVVRVLGGDPLQILGPLGQLLGELSHGGVLRTGGLLGHRRLVLAHLLPCFGVRAGRGGGPLLPRRHPDRTGDRVDAPLVADDDPRLLVPVTHRRSLSSSTISASTTSSSPPGAEPDAAPVPASPLGAPSPAAASACWEYSAPPTSCETRATFSCADLMASMLEPPRAERSSVSASPSSSFFSAGILSPFSARNFSVWYCSDSARLRVSASSRRFLSSSACASASFIIRSMSSLGRAEPPVMVIDCSLPVPRSLAWTWTMPLASMSKATSICGTPRGAGGRPVSSNMPSFLLYIAISRSPWNTWICTEGWLSSAVVKISERLVGIVVLRSMSLVMIPPLVSMPRDSGVTSRSRTSFTSPRRTPAWSAAPMATTSSGLTPLLGSLPPVSSLTRSETAGMRVEPPTRTTWSIWPTEMPASRIAWLNGARARSSRSCVSRWNSARVIVTSRCRGPSAPAVM